jgi:hypothetical protein
MWGGGENNEAIRFGDIDISAWHSVSHGDPDGAAGQQIIRLQAYFADEFRYFVEKLASVPDGEVSLLDNTAAVLCTQNGNSQLGSTQSFAQTDHPPQHAPFVVAGSCGGAWTIGRLIDAGGPQSQRRLRQHRQGPRDGRDIGGPRRPVPGPAHRVSRSHLS